MAKLSISDFKRNNFMLLCIVAVAAVMFIFIPDFIGFGSDGRPILDEFSLEFPNPHKTGEQGTSNVKVTQTTSEAPVEVDPALVAELQSQPPLARLAQMIDSGYIEHLVKTREQAPDASAETESSDGTVRASLNPAAIPALQSQQQEDSTVPGTAEPAPPAAPEGLEFLVQNQQADWKDIKSRPAKRVFARVELGATALLNQIPNNKPRSRTALMNYISALSKVPSSGERALTAPEAVSYLNSLDTEVTRALTAEKAPRAVLHDWAELSLSPVLGRQNTDVLRERSVPKFNPQPTIVRAKFQTQATPKGALTFHDPLYLFLTIQFTGAEIESVQMYKNDEPSEFLRLAKVAEKGQTNFLATPTRLTLPGKFTLVALDEYGNEFRKNYFLGKPKFGGWRYDAGPNMWILNLTPHSSNPAIDRLFPSRGLNEQKQNSFALLGNSGNSKFISTF